MPILYLTKLKLSLLIDQILLQAQNMHLLVFGLTEKILKISNIIYRRKSFGTKQLSSKFKFFTVGVGFLSSALCNEKQFQKSHLFTRKILLDFFHYYFRDITRFITVYSIIPKKFYWKSLDFKNTNATVHKQNFCFK